MTMHTPPTPWTMHREHRLTDSGGTVFIVDANGRNVGAVHGRSIEQARATAELILAAVNGRAAIEAALGKEETAALELLSRARVERQQRADTGAFGDDEGRS